jgi:PKD repeat protein
MEVAFTLMNFDRSLVRPERRIAAAIWAAVLAIALGATYVASTGTPASAADGRTWVVDAVDDADGNRFVSRETGTSELTVEVGDTVEWRFDTPLAAQAHDLTSLDLRAIWSPPVQLHRNPGDPPISYEFTAPGSYFYECSTHGTVMQGVVQVVEPGSVNTPPTAAPMATPTAGAAPLQVAFMAHGSDADGDALAYLWDFGTGDPADTSTAENPTFVYTDAGSYDASVTVSDPHGGSVTEELTITVGGLQVDAAATPTSGPAPLEVDFAAVTTGATGDVNHAWDFGVTGTGDAATTADATYTYDAPGTYTATVTASDDVTTATDSVTVTVADDTLPEVRALASPSDDPTDLAVPFTTEVTTSGPVRSYADGLATYPDVDGTATMVRTRNRTVTTLDVTGVKPGVAHQSHVHERACADQRGGVHFRFDESQPFAEVKRDLAVLHRDRGRRQRSGRRRQADARGSEGGFGRRSRPRQRGPADRLRRPRRQRRRPHLRLGLRRRHHRHRARPGTHLHPFGPLHRDGHGEPAPATRPPRPCRSWSATSTPPDTRITAGPAAVTRTDRATYRFTSSEPGSTFECRLDAGPWERCSPSITYRYLADGSRLLRVRAVDPAGKPRPDARLAPLARRHRQADRPPPDQAGPGDRHRPPLRHPPRVARPPRRRPEDQGHPVRRSHRPPHLDPAPSPHPGSAPRRAHGRRWGRQPDHEGVAVPGMRQRRHQLRHWSPSRPI